LAESRSRLCPARCWSGSFCRTKWDQAAPRGGLSPCPFQLLAARRLHFLAWNHTANNLSWTARSAPGAPWPTSSAASRL